MRAIIASQPGGPEVLTFVERPTPDVAAGQVLVKVAATAVNRADLLQCAGKYPPPKGETDILGLEFSGEIMQIGADVTSHQVGDRVCGLLAAGGYAQYVVVDARHLLTIPADMSYEAAAAIPEAYLTAFQALFMLAHLQERDTVLIHAASGGVGSAAIRLAKAAGATVIATASAGKHDFCRSLGADIVLDYHVGEDLLVEKIMQATVGKGVNMVLDFFAASYLGLHLRVLATDGALITLALMEGATTPKAINLSALIAKRLTIKGSTLRNRDADYKADLVRRFGDRFWPDVLPIVDSVLDWEQVQKAYTRMSNRLHTGKIVLKIH